LPIQPVAPILPVPPFQPIASYFLTYFFNVIVVTSPA